MHPDHGFFFDECGGQSNQAIATNNHRQEDESRDVMLIQVNPDPPENVALTLQELLDHMQWGYRCVLFKDKFPGDIVLYGFLVSRALLETRHRSHPTLPHSHLPIAKH
jgi:hypothetical protein